MGTRALVCVYACVFLVGTNCCFFGMCGLDLLAVNIAAIVSFLKPPLNFSCLLFLGSIISTSCLPLSEILCCTFRKGKGEKGKKNEIRIGICMSP